MLVWRRVQPQFLNPDLRITRSGWGFRHGRSNSKSNSKSKSNSNSNSNSNIKTTHPTTLIQVEGQVESCLLPSLCMLLSVTWSRSCSHILTATNVRFLWSFQRGGICFPRLGCKKPVYGHISYMNPQPVNPNPFRELLFRGVSTGFLSFPWGRAIVAAQ